MRPTITRTIAAAIALLFVATTADAFRLCARVDSSTGGIRASAPKIRAECRVGREVPVEIDGFGRVVEVYLPDPDPTPIENPDPSCDLDAPLLPAPNGTGLCAGIGKPCEFVVSFVDGLAYSCDANLESYLFGGCCR